MYSIGVGLEEKRGKYQLCGCHSMCNVCATIFQNKIRSNFHDANKGVGWLGWFACGNECYEALCVPSLALFVLHSTTTQCHKILPLYRIRRQAGSSWFWHDVSKELCATIRPRYKSIPFLSTSKDLCVVVVVVKLEVVEAIIESVKS